MTPTSSIANGTNLSRLDAAYLGTIDDLLGPLGLTTVRGVRRTAPITDGTLL